MIKNQYINGNQLKQKQLIEPFFEGANGVNIANSEITGSPTNGENVITNKKADLLYKYNQINNKVNKLMAKNELLLEKEAKNKTLEKARELLKKKVEFHKYWLDKIYSITFYTHIVLVFLVLALLLYKLL